MEKNAEKRATYRRYEDRRVAMMLVVHEIIFDEAPGVLRDRRILAELAENYQVERVAIIQPLRDRGLMRGRVVASFGDWQREDEAIRVDGEGFDRLVELHDTAEGALSFESVRKSEAFSDEAWRSLWTTGVGAPTRALLSMKIEGTDGKMIWLQQSGSTREWSSRDRNLIEEVADLLSRAAARGI